MSAMPPKDNWNPLTLSRRTGSPNPGCYPLIWEATADDDGDEVTIKGVNQDASIVSVEKTVPIISDMRIYSGDRCILGRSAEGIVVALSLAKTQAFEFNLTITANACLTGISPDVPFDLTIQMTDQLGTPVTTYEPDTQVDLVAVDADEEAVTIDPISTDNTGWANGAKTIEVTLSGVSEGDVITITANDADAKIEGYKTTAIDAAASFFRAEVLDCVSTRHYTWYQATSLSGIADPICCMGSPGFTLLIDGTFTQPCAGCGAEEFVALLGPLTWDQVKGDLEGNCSYNATCHHIRDLVI